MSDCLWFDHRVSKVGVRVGEMGKKKKFLVFFHHFSAKSLSLPSVGFLVLLGQAWASQ